MFNIAPEKKSFNNYEIRGEITAIFLENKAGEKFETLIDTEDLDRIKEMDLHWHLRYDVKTEGYYAKATETYYDNEKRKQRSIYLHIEIMKSNTSEKEYVDHKNHNTLDNRKDNLRITTFQKNTMNRNSKNKNNSTGYRNVILDKRSGKYKILLCINYKSFRVGKLYEDVHEAGRDAEKYRKQYYKEYAGKS